MHRRSSRKGTVWIGGDSAGISGYDVTVRADEKVFQNGPFVMGFTTSFHMGQILRYAFKPPVQVGDDDMSYMVVEFIDALRKCYSEKGILKKEHNTESSGCFLIGYKGNLYSIESDFQVEKSMDNFNAVGCGADVAKGSLFATSGIPPFERLNMALNAAVYLNIGVRPPYKIISVSQDKIYDEERTIWHPA